MVVAAYFAALGLALAQTAGAPDTIPAKQQPSANSAGLVDRVDETASLKVPRTYTLGVGDVIHIDVFEEPQFDATDVVRPDGKISLPLLSEVAVAGLTPVAAQDLLAGKLEKYVRHPRVTVSVKEIHSRVVYVTGEVLRPGAYALADTIDVVQLIARAGGVTAYARKKNVYVLRAGSSVRARVDYGKVLRGQRADENVQLNPGDTVVVP